MELENLKYIWHTLEAPPVPPTERRDLLALLRRKSRGPITRMRRNLVREGLILLLTYIPAVGCYLLEFEGRLSAIGWLLAFNAAFFFGYYYRKYRLLKGMECVTCEVRSNLARQVETLKKYTRFYVLAGTAAIPLTYILSWFIIRWKLPAAGSALYHQLHPAPWWADPLHWLILLIPLTIGIYYLNRWYVNKLYGQHIKKIKVLLEEMEME